MLFFNSIVEHAQNHLFAYKELNSVTFFYLETISSYLTIFKIVNNQKS
jgi:hypothetical protein